MSTLLLSPHNDDEVLFAAYTLLRYQPTVIRCFASEIQAQRGGPTRETRDLETRFALKELSVFDYIEAPMIDTDPDEDILVELLSSYDKDRAPKRVFAPAPEVGGHEQHTIVGQAADRVFGERVTYYLTYKRGYGRSWSQNEVTPEPHWPALKFRAMSCYASQINLLDCQPWFAADDCLREWYA